MHVHCHEDYFNVRKITTDQIIYDYVTTIIYSQIRKKNWWIKKWNKCLQSLQSKIILGLLKLAKTGLIVNFFHSKLQEIIDLVMFCDRTLTVLRAEWMNFKILIRDLCRWGSIVTKSRILVKENSNHWDIKELVSLCHWVSNWLQSISDYHFL